MRRLLTPLIRGTLAVLLAGIGAISSIQQASAYEVHIVQPGETLSQIANQYGTSVSELLQLNSLDDANFVWYGQRLLVDSVGIGAGVPQVAGNSEVYVVQGGDSLTRIAERFGLDVRELARFNGISPLRWLYRGQVLRLPGSPASVPIASASVTDSGAADFEDGQRYTVRPGDSLARLARRHGISLSQLMSMNGLSSANWLYVGQVLLVPGLSAPALQPAPQPAPEPAPPVPALQPAPPFAALQPGHTGATSHTVQEGETFESISGQYGVSAPAIIRLNGLTNRSALESGQTLRIPSGSALELLENLPNRLNPSQYPTSTERWIEVDLSEQLAVAYEGTQPVKAFVISSGVGSTPTVKGTFRIWAKIVMQDMSGGSRAAGTYYHLKDVPDVQFFHRGYGFHGTYWHDNFGTPMSRGCVNMTKEDAKWLFDWTSPTVYGDEYLFSTSANPGTLVLVRD